MVLKVTVKFDDGVNPNDEGVALLAFEKHLRQITKLDCRVFKQKMGDDSKLRILMTPKQREAL